VSAQDTEDIIAEIQSLMKQIERVAEKVDEILTLVQIEEES
jgi:uncharacterized protein YwgA